MKRITLEDVKKNKEVLTYIEIGNENLGVLGYTEHEFKHLEHVALTAAYILKELGYSERDIELAQIAGFLHDIGNVINRHDHGQSGALIAMRILAEMGMDPKEIAVIAAAIGNHEEEYGQPLNPVSAALIIADKSDVHRRRVRNPDFSTFDIHDRVNYAAKDTKVRVDKKERIITLIIEIDSAISKVMEYFEIFLSRMIMCRRAADFLGCQFELVINGVKLL